MYIPKTYTGSFTSYSGIICKKPFHLLLWHTKAVIFHLDKQI